MDNLLDQYAALSSRYDSITKIYGYTRAYGFPFVQKISNLAQHSLFEHPDLTSIALLLVIFYISFVFLLKAWHVTLHTLRLSFKAIFYSAIGLCLLGTYNAVINNDATLFRGMFNTAQFMLRFVGDFVIGGDTRKEKQ